MDLAIAPETGSAPPPSLKPPRLDEPDRGELLRYFENTWALYEWLFSSVPSDGTLYLAPDPLRHPLVFYLGHTAAFYVNKLKLAGLIPEGVDEGLERLFEMGVDPERPADLESRDDWPEETRVRGYRVRVHELVCDVIERVPLDEPIGPDRPLWALMMGLEHDRIHFETSSVLIRQAPVDRVARPDGWAYAPSRGVPEDSTLREVPGGLVELGKPQSLPTFGWDNEYGRRVEEVPPFLAGRFPVTNAEWLGFVEAGGYGDRRLWSAEGRAWRERNDVRHPRFWVPGDGGFAYRATFDVLDLPLDWPVEVNAHEAEAFCRWLGEGSRLPTEAEFVKLSSSVRREAGDLMFDDVGNLNLRFGSPCPVGSVRSARSDDGLDDVVGNVWFWLADDFAPLPGFETHPYYRDFSEPFFDDRHAMMLGGSWATTGTGASQFYRLWFRRHFYQHAGFRVARDA